MWGYELPNTAKVLVVICVIVNAIVLLNFIIAILADTYSKLMSTSLGLYYDGIIQSIPSYAYDDRYGGLIIGVPPFSVLAVFLLPIYLLVKDE